jgi:hypothetical protein
VIPAPVAVAFAAFVVAVLALAALALAGMVAAEAVTGWTPPPPRTRPRHLRTRRSPGVQYWTRSVDTDTATITVIDGEGRRVA